MPLDAEYKKVNRITIGFNKTQFNSLKKLKEYDVNISQFIRIAIKEKIKRDWKIIKEEKEKKNYHFKNLITMEKFEFTTQGYVDAVKYLKKIKKYKYVSTHGFSTDGWSIIGTANVFYEKK